MTSEKECVLNANIDKCAVVLLDVAGTTTSLAFVKETLFKFATDNAQRFLKDNWEDEEIKKAVKLLQEGDAELDVDGAIEVFKKLSGENSDNKGLKSLQGLIYKKGYADKALKAHVFSDVPKTLENWSKEHKVAIYSTGSIESQRLLFTHTAEGDLSQYISHYFDQSTGLKTKSESYKKIAEELKVKTEEILLINDNIDELKAAKEAGVIPVLVKREGNEEVSEEASKNFTIISSFADLHLDNPNKRKNEDEIDGTEAPPTKIAKTEEQANDASTAESSVEAVKEKPEVVEEKPGTVEESKVVGEKLEASQSKPELIEDKQESKEQPVEKTKAESTVEPMEVDAPEIEIKITAEDKNTNATTENDATNATPKEVTNKEVNVAEAMETEQPTENAVVEVKTAVEPVVDSKTDTEKLAEKDNKEETKVSDKQLPKKAENETKASDTELPKKTEKETKESDTELPKKAEEETMETENKTEESHPKKDVEVASSTASVEVKKNGVEIVEAEVLEKKTENVEVAEEAMEVAKEKEQNSELNEDSTEMAKEATENNKEEIKVAAEAVESKNEEENKPETNVDKTVNETEKKEVKETQPTAKAATEEKVSVEAIKEQKELKESDKVTKESKDQKSTEAEKSSGENVTLSTTIEACPEETKKQTVAEKCSEETKEPCPKETGEPPAAKQEGAEKNKEIEAEGKVEVAKNEVAKNENIISETVPKESKDNIEETVKPQENTSESKFGNGSCDLKATEDVAKNGEITNGQENGDKKNDETDSETTDIKIKKLETNAGSPAVSVEV